MVRGDVIYIESSQRRNNRPIHSANLKDCSHGWDKGNAPGSWESERKEEAYNTVLKFLKSIY